MYLRMATVFVFFLMCTSTSVFADGFVCGHGAESGEGGSSLGPSPRARFVYVSFPNDVSGVLTVDHQEILTTLQTYYAEHSQGSFTLDGSSDIILHQGEEIGSSATAWMAEREAEFYAADILPPELGPEFDVCETWLSGVDDNWATALCAEIFRKIQIHWEGEDAGFLADTDYLIMVLLTRDSPFGQNSTGTVVEGRAEIALDASALDGDPFFDGLERDGPRIKGTIQLFVTETGADFSPRESVKGIAHEMAHTLGAGDGPPNQYYEIPDLATYYYGNRNLMCQTQIPGEGIPPIGLGWLQDLDWRGSDPDPLVVDFAGENLINHRMTDIALPGGKLYRFKPDSTLLPTGAVQDQYFLMAYHSQVSWIDTQENDDGEYLVRGPGIEVWHCIGDAMWDMESASGLFADPREPDETSPPTGWAMPDPVSGYDNHDMWPEIYFPVANTYPAREKGAFGRYAGEATDFFSLNLSQVEFNSETNPSTAWYRDSQEEILRRNPQDLTNPMIVDFLEDNGDGSILVNLLTGPFEPVWVSYPDPTIPEVQHGEVLTIHWGDIHLEDDFTEVEIYFSADAGGNYEKITPNPVLHSEHQYLWTVPIHVEGTLHGWLKVVFFNEHSPLGGTFVYPRDHYPGTEPDPIVVDFPIAIEEDILSPEVGAEVFANTSVRIEWSSFFNDAGHGGFGPDYGVVVSSVDLELKRGDDWEGIASQFVLSDVVGEPGSYHYDEHHGVNYYLWAPTNDQVTANGQIRLTLNYAQDGGSQGSTQTEGESVFQVYPLTVKYVDRSSEAQLLRRQPGGYFGEPSCVMALDYNADEDFDVFVGMTSGDGPFLGDNSQGAFSKVFGAFPVGGGPDQGTKFAITGDFNWDGNSDFFCGHGENPRLYLHQGTGANPVFDNVESSLPQSIVALLPWTDSAAWLDLDHDHDMDLILGRAEPGIGGGKVVAPDYLLINNGPLVDWDAYQLEDRTPYTTNAVSGMDFDKDGYWELAVGVEDRSPSLMIFEETATGEFSLMDEALPAGGSLSRISQLAWIDFNNDGWFDLVELDAGNEAVVLLNDQNGWFSEAVSLGSADLLEFLDFNGDGWLDYVSGHMAAETESNLWMNVGGLEGFSDGFVYAGEAAGLTGNGVNLQAVLGAPFSNDGTPDLITLRDEEDDRFFQAVDPTDENSSPQVSYISIGLVNEVDNTPYPAFGAVIELRDNSGHQQWRRVEGEAAFGSQKPQAVSFGLGGFEGEVSGTVYLPEGRQIGFTVSDPMPDIQVPALTGADINIHEVNAFSKIKPDSRRDLHFQWITNLRCSNQDDQILISNASGDCELPPVLKLNEGITNLDYDMYLGEDGKWHHEFILWDVPCLPQCSFDFMIGSKIGSVEATTTSSWFSARPCAVTPPWDPGDPNEE